MSPLHVRALETRDPVPSWAGRALDRYLPPGLVVVLVGVSLAQVVFYFCRTVDDCFISLRYADHWASGRGLVYNPGERVEGHSSPAWVLLSSVGFLLGLDATLWLKVLGLSSLTLLFWVVYQYLSRRHGMSPAVATLALIGLASNSYVMSWGLLGLETPLYLALLLGLPLCLWSVVQRPTRGRQALAAAALVLLAATRPEAPLYAGLVCLAVLVSGWSTSLRERVIRLYPVVGLAAACLVSLLVARRLHYGLWLPHTYYAKAGAGLAPERLEAILAQGASPLEQALLGAGLVLAGWAGLRRRDPVPLAVVLANLVFATLVIEDWMPNQRHFLPTWVMVTLGLAMGIDRWLRRALCGAPWSAVSAALCLSGLVACSSYQFGIDSRFSSFDFRSHGRGVEWVRQKSSERWHDAWLALTRRVPPHVEAMSLERMGMIQQLYWVLEASADPLAHSWYVGRDIGRVGYFSPVRIFDTDGLFTPEVVRDPGWAEDRSVSVDLGRKVFARRPVAAQLFDGFAVLPNLMWDELRSYRRLAGRLERIGPPPSARQVLARYARAAERFPKSFYLATIYGECVGAAFERRHAHVKSRHAAPGTSLMTHERHVAP